MAIRSCDLKEGLRNIQGECSDERKELAGYANGDYSKYFKREISALTNFLNKQFKNK